MDKFIYVDKFVYGEISMSLRVKPGMPCPKCGLPIKAITSKRVGDRVYLYAYHGYVDVDPITKRKKPKVCYLGPEDHYEYVTKTHDFALEGLVALDREVRYLENLVEYELERLTPFISKPLAERLLNALVKIARKLIEENKIDKEYAEEKIKELIK